LFARPEVELEMPDRVTTRRRTSRSLDGGRALATHEARHVAAHALRQELETCASRRGGGRHGGARARERTSVRTAPPRPEPPSGDERLLGALAADPSALGALYERYAKPLYRLAFAILGSREEAEDLTHEVFVSVCRPTLYDAERGTVGAFLATMTRSRAIDRLRHRARSARLMKTWHEATSASPPRTPFEHASMRRTAERVRAVLAELPDAQREVLEMAYYRGLTQREIAADLDTPLGTVKTLSRRALSTLGRAAEDLAG